MAVQHSVVWNSRLERGAETVVWNLTVKLRPALLDEPAVAPRSERCPHYRPLTVLGVVQVACNFWGPQAMEAFHVLRVPTRSGDDLPNGLAAVGDRDGASRAFGDSRMRVDPHQFIDRRNVISGRYWMGRWIGSNRVG